MKASTSYRVISAFLCISIFVGSVSPVFGHSISMKHCSSSMSHDAMKPDSTHNHMKMNESMNMDSDCCANNMMNHHSSDNKHQDSETCDAAIDCMCDFTHSAFKKEALLISKIKIPDFNLSKALYEMELQLDNHVPPPLELSNSYSPPLLFLTNESFLI